MAPPSYEELEHAFFTDGYHLASGISSSDGILQAVEDMYGELDLFLDTFLKNASRSDDPPDCRKGCSYCCHQAVFAQEHEFKFLKNWMFTRLDSAEIEGIRERAVNKKKHTDTLSADSRLLYKSPCPLLADNVCMAYPARPVACRIYISKDLASCLKEFYQPEDRSNYPGLFDLPLRLGRKLNEGFSAGLQERGFPANEFRLEEGILR